MKVLLRTSPGKHLRDAASVVATGTILRHAQSVALRVSRCLFDGLGRTAGLCLSDTIPATSDGVRWARQRCPPSMSETACIAYANGRDDEAVSGLTVNAITGAIVTAIILNTYGAGRYATAEQIRRVTMWAVATGAVAVM